MSPTQPPVTVEWIDVCSGATALLRNPGDVPATINISYDGQIVSLTIPPHTDRVYRAGQGRTDIAGDGLDAAHQWTQPANCASAVPSILPPNPHTEQVPMWAWPAGALLAIAVVMAALAARTKKSE